MLESNRIRLRRIAERWDRQRAALGHDAAAREAEKADAFAREFVRVRGAVLRPVIEQIGAELRRAGHDVEIRQGDDPPRLDLHLLVRGRTGSEDRIQLFLVHGPERGHEVCVELVLKRSPVELARYAWPGDITPEVAEHLLVDAIEQLFASPPV